MSTCPTHQAEDCWACEASDPPTFEVAVQAWLEVIKKLNSEPLELPF